MKAKTVRAMSKGRSIHLVDLENLCMESNPTEEHVASAKGAYFQTFEPAANDLIHVTVSSKNDMAEAIFGWGCGRAR